ncbi:hypothetical protein [Thalassococcus lentus]|uniref:Uncharacterized protein n=1 Tax=Thalassococcus lentus TaxID=1210524 RepID=A0ABT4XVU1_9RHOB|nr:hypothetical protein [Thalassococcus lentus]MDA7426083.1 hypothetical protein [Thalassococcus lentus]
MRLGFVLSVGMIALMPVAGAAEDTPAMDCAEQAELVMQAVNARAEGEPKRKTRRMLRAALDREAGDMLADFIYTLPEDQLTDAVGDAYKAQCEAL